MKTWDDWSDIQVNIAIIELLYGKLGDDKDILRLYRNGRFNYCNNWSDIGPLIFENRIAIAPHPLRRDDRGLWMCIADDERGIYTRDGKNPLRAAAIVFLMMKGVKPCSQ